MTRISPTFGRFLRQQQLYLAIAAAVYLVFWAIGQESNIPAVLIYSIILGNTCTVVAEQVMRHYADSGRARQWMIFVPLLLGVTAVAVIVSTAAVYLVTKTEFSFPRYLATSWKFPALVTLIVGIVLFLYRSTKERLEKDNLELQRSIDVEAAQRELQEQELQRALEIQRSLLPKTIPQVAGFEIEGAWEPSRVVGGDYYDVIKLGETKLGICIADVAGKSISAALLMANVQATVRAFATETVSPAQLCTRVNSVLCNNIAAGKFVTMFYGVLDGISGVFEYANAGHLYPIVVNQAGNTRRLNDGGALLGILPEWKYENGSVRLNAGDRVLLFTDGITEAEWNGQEFGEDRVAVSASRMAENSAAEMKNALIEQVKSYCNSQLQDDATLVIIGRSGNREVG